MSAPQIRNTFIQKYRPIQSSSSTTYSVAHLWWQLYCPRGPINKSQKLRSKSTSLVFTYVVCERLSVMQRLPESGKAEFVLKLGRTPCSEIWSRTPLPPQKKLKFRQILRLGFRLHRTPTPPSPWLECVKTNCCIPQGYHLVCEAKSVSKQDILIKKTALK